MKGFFLLFYMCLLGFVLTYGLFSLYGGLYGIPFGMWDVDNYWCWLGGGMFDMDCCNFLGAFINHWVIFSVLKFYPDVMVSINLVIPFLLWVGLPVGVFSLYYTVLRDSWGAWVCCSFFMFGSFSLMFFGVASLWSQLLAFVLFVFSLVFYFRGDVFVFFFLSVFACFTHPFMFFGYMILLFSELLFYRCFRWFFVVGLCFLVILFFIDLPYENFLFFTSSHFPEDSVKVEPGLYHMFFVYTNPFILLLSLVGVLACKCRLKWLFVLFGLITPLSHLGRGLMFGHLFMCVYAYLGLVYLVDVLGRGWLWVVVLVIVLLLHFERMLNYFLDNMLFEMPFRGLDPTLFKDLINYPK